MSIGCRFLTTGSNLNSLSVSSCQHQKHVLTEDDLCVFTRGHQWEHDGHRLSSLWVINESVCPAGSQKRTELRVRAFESWRMSEQRTPALLPVKYKFNPVMIETETSRRSRTIAVALWQKAAPCDIIQKLNERAHVNGAQARETIIVRNKERTANSTHKIKYECHPHHSTTSHLVVFFKHEFKRPNTEPRELGYVRNRL